MNAWQHLLLCLGSALRYPRSALLGIVEFRSEFTTWLATEDQQDAYNSGRQLAHIATLRWWDR